MAIDYGAKRVGLAVTDPLGMFAYPLVTLANDKFFWENFLKYFSEYEIELVLLGYPLKESGEKSSSTELVEKFHKKLSAKIKTEIILRDERYTSAIAKERIIQTVPSKKKRRDKGLLDKNAAAVILEDYLNESN